MKTVVKKIDKEWLDIIIAGKKKFELRLADFDIQDGDILRLEEWTGEEKKRGGVESLQEDLLKKQFPMPGRLILLNGS